MPASNAPITLSDDERVMLQAAIDHESDVTEWYQITEMRLRADVMEAKRARVSLLKSLCSTHGLDPSQTFEYESATGVLKTK